MSNADPAKQRAKLLAQAGSDVEACWPWPGSTTRGGYGVMRTGPGTRDYVHRVAYRLFVGAIPDGMQIDHLCRTRACFNPAHLEAVTSAENVARGVPYRTPLVHEKPAFCSNGHEMTEENTYKPSRGWKCRECMRRWQRERYTPAERQPETHCRRRGHEFTPENTIIQATGARTCRACRTLSRRQRPAAMSA